MTFREILKKDAEDVFVSPEEFGEQHEINGKEICISVDGIEQMEREKKELNINDGLKKKRLLFYARAKDFGPLPTPGRRLQMDGEEYIITDAAAEGGTYSISIEAVRMR